MNHYQTDDRYERKYTLPPDSIDKVIWLIKHHLNFRLAYLPRYVHSLYWDTADLLFAHQSLDGHSHRIKLRHRWYGALLPVSRLRFETKVKNGYLVAKHVYVLSNSSKFTDPTFKQFKALHRSHLPTKLMLDSLMPTLLVSYLRHYYVSTAGIRLTLDVQYQSAKVIHQQYLAHSKLRSHPFAILELKYPPDKEFTARTVIQTLPLYRSRCSKYLTGFMYDDKLDRSNIY